MIDVSVSMSGSQLASAIQQDDEEMACFLVEMATVGIPPDVADYLGSVEATNVRNMLTDFIEKLDRVPS